MARKDLMNGLMNSPEVSSDSDARVDASKPRYSTGAIGAVSRSIEDLKRRAIVDVDPRMVDDAGLRDRLDRDDAELAGLIQSIRDHGQQVPVLLRFNPNYEGRYQVVYGRRRVAALKALGQPVKALIRNLDDKALVLAQGQENTARMNWRSKVNRRLVVVPLDQSDEKRRKAEYPAHGLAVDHLRVGDIDPALAPEWMRPGLTPAEE